MLRYIFGFYFTAHVFNTYSNVNILARKLNNHCAQTALYEANSMMIVYIGFCTYISGF